MALFEKELVTIVEHVRLNSRWVEKRGIKGVIAWVGRLWMGGIESG